MDSFFAKQVKTGEIVRAQDVRDILGKIASDEGKSSTHIMQDYIKGDIDLEEAHARFEATGRSGDNYEKVKKFQRLIILYLEWLRRQTDFTALVKMKPVILEYLK